MAAMAPSSDSTFPSAPNICSIVDQGCDSQGEVGRFGTIGGPRSPNTSWISSESPVGGWHDAGMSSAGDIGPFETERLSLRPLLLADAELLLAKLNRDAMRKSCSS